jgi:predicted  nucleic acid-binding Zn-ribbon protein
MFTLKLLLDVTPSLSALVRDVISQHGNGEIMATLQDIVDATTRNGAEARAATARVAEDFQALSQQITDLKAQIEGGVNNAAELAALKAGLDDVKTQIDASTAELTGLDPLPNNPPKP